MNEECDHIYVLVHKLQVDGAKASMIPAGYMCIKCGKTLFELTGIMGPSVWIKEDNDEPK